MQNSSGRFDTYMTFYKHYYKTIFISMAVWVLPALIYPIYSARIAYLGVFLAIMAGHIARYFNKNFIVEQHITVLPVRKRRALTVVVVLMAISLGGGLAMFPNALINWTLSPNWSLESK